MIRINDSARFSKQRIILLAAGLIAGFSAFLAVASSHVSAESANQSLKFSHDKHVKELGVQCTDCHDAALKSSSATDNLLAKKANCQSCHEDQLKTNCTYCHTSDKRETYRATPNPKRELIFSHQLHTEKNSIACETCHTDLDKAEVAVGQHIPTMATCTSCHNNLKAPMTCETCHRDLSTLRPLSHTISDFMREHKRFARLSTANCTSCHTQETCVDCHNNPSLTKVDTKGSDLMSPRSPRLAPMDRGQNTALTKVHDLNFKFTHGISAKGKISDCQTCHNQQQFCVTCHMGGGNINQGKFKPVSHGDLDFVRIGVGSGGGKHAVLARRDIESCASCHDTQGADPTCITCHVDPDGRKGTDPKTHPTGFMANVHGEWHTDPGASCYVCHMDPNARVNGNSGQKFCGYCHGKK